MNETVLFLEKRKKETSPLKWCVVTPFHQGEVFAIFGENFGIVSAESSGEGGLIVEKR